MSRRGPELPEQSGAGQVLEQQGPLPAQLRQRPMQVKGGSHNKRGRLKENDDYFNDEKTHIFTNRYIRFYVL